MNREHAIRKVLPVLIPAITAIAMAIVTIRLGCIDSGTSVCENVTEFISRTEIHKSAFQEVMSLFGF